MLLQYTSKLELTAESSFLRGNFWGFFPVLYSTLLHRIHQIYEHMQYEKKLKEMLKENKRLAEPTV
jgi:hypothetical protein